MKLFIFPGELDRDFYERLLDGQSRVSIGCALFDDAALAAKWAGYVPSEAIWHWDRLVVPEPLSTETPLHRVHYERVLRAMMADPRTYYILERQFRAIDKDIFFNSVFNRTVELEILIWNTLTMLSATRPDRFVHYNVPHGKLWFVARVAELVGIDAYVAATSPLPWKDWAVKGLDEQQPVMPPEEATATGGSRITDFISTVKGHYATAMPSYEKKRFEYFKGGFYSPKKELRSLAYAALTTRSAFTGFMRGLHSLRKRAALMTYERLCAGFALPKKFVVFFLHYQPERTSVPEGQGYGQQWLALRALANALPDGYQLVVKEHPSTFRYNFDPSFRSLQLYEQISRLPNTRLVPLNFSPFDLIDKASAVATITGTVGIEAIIRGKPVIVFGSAQYRGRKGVFWVRSSDEARAVMAQIDGGVDVMSDAEVEAFLFQVDGMAFHTDLSVRVASAGVMRTAIFADLVQAPEQQQPT
jgi:hypothetical protein